MGVGVIHCKSGKQKLNVNRCTEAEFVGTSNYIQYNLLLLIFMGGQGCPIKDNILY